MEKEITREEAQKARETLIQWIEQSIDLDYEMLIDGYQKEKLLYIALTQDLNTL